MMQWEFEEVEAVETWQQLLSSQALDIGLFAAFAALALTSFFRKSVSTTASSLKTLVDSRSVSE